MLAGEGFIGGGDSDEELEDESALASKSLLQNGELPANYDEIREQRREEKLYNKIYDRFRVLNANEVDAMLE